MGFFEGFEKRAQEDVLVSHASGLSPTILRSLIGGAAGAGVGAVLGREAGSHLARIPPAPWSRAGEMMREFSPMHSKKVMEVVEALGRSRGAIAGATGLGLLGMYLGSKPSFD